MHTIKQYIDTNTIDIIELLSLVLKRDKVFIYTNIDYVLNIKQQELLSSLIKRRLKGEPFAYLVGSKGFYHLDFKVNKHTLIPRPETELIVDIVLELLPHKKQKIIDLGTGSGIIAITLKSKRKLWEVLATDISDTTLTIAKTNAIDNNCNISFINSSWFEGINNDKFNIIISNPPYIEKQDKHLSNLTYEPINALISGVDGLDDIRLIIRKSPNYLLHNGYILLEHGYNQQDKIVKLLAKDFKNIKTFKDFNNIPRCVLAQKS